MDMKQVLSELRKPFPPEYIEWKVQSKSKDGASGAAAAFVDVRRYQDRLDAVDPTWTAKYEFLKDDASLVMCHLTINGVTRCDIGSKEESGFNVETSVVAQAQKRAATTFGLGRDLYFLPMQWVPIDDRGRFTRPPQLPDWYYEKCGLPIAGGKPAIVAKAEAVMNGETAPDDFDNLSQDDIPDANAPVAPVTFGDLIKDDTFRKSWWADVKKLGYTEDTAKARLGVASTKDITLTAPQVWEKLASFCPIHNAENRKFEKDGSTWYSHKQGESAWCNGGKVKESKK